MGGSGIVGVVGVVVVIAVGVVVARAAGGWWGSGRGY